jgi:hypothetical protein
VPRDTVADINEYAHKLHLHFQKQFTATESLLKIRKYIIFLKKTGPVMDNYFQHKKFSFLETSRPVVLSAQSPIRCAQQYFPGGKSAGA